MGFVIWNTVVRKYFTGEFLPIRGAPELIYATKFTENKREARHFPSRGAAVGWLTEHFPFGAPETFEIEASDFVIY